MKFNRKLVYTSEDRYLVFEVEGEGAGLILTISCENSPGGEDGASFEELEEGYELVELLTALEGVSVYNGDYIEVDRHRITFRRRDGVSERFVLGQSELSELKAVIRYLIPIFALGVEA